MSLNPQKRLLYLMHVSWGWIKQRPHFLAEELAQRFCTLVVYSWDGTDPKQQVANRSGVWRVPLRRGWWTPRPLSGEQQRAYLSRCVERFDPDVIWMTFPTFYDSIPPRKQGSPVLVYDCMDEPLAFARSEADRQAIAKCEADLIAHLDIAFASSPLLRERLIALGCSADRVHLVANAYGGSILAEPAAMPVSRRSASAPFRLGYFGTIAHWLDFEALIYCLDHIAELELHLIGPVAVDVPKHARLVLHGPVEHDRLQRTCESFDCMILPFKRLPMTEYVDPVKLYEYVNLGKNVLARYYPALETFSNYVMFYNDRVELVEQIGRLMHSNTRKYSGADRLHFLRRNSWADRANQITTTLDRAMASGTSASPTTAPNRLPAWVDVLRFRSGEWALPFRLPVSAWLLLRRSGVGAVRDRIVQWLREDLPEPVDRPQRKERSAASPPVPARDTVWPFVDAVIVTYNSSDKIGACLDALERADYPRDRVSVTIVDNASTDGTIGHLQHRIGGKPGWGLIRNRKNVGFGTAVNQAVKTATAPFVLLLNPDAEVEPNALRRLVSRALSSRSNGFCAWEARQQPHEHPKHYDPLNLETEWVSGACVLFDRAAFEQVGGFDRDIFLYAEDVDISWRLRAAGFRLAYVADAVVRHWTHSADGLPKASAFYHGIVSNALLRIKYGTSEEIRTFLRLFGIVWLQPPPLPAARRRLVLQMLRTAPRLARTAIARWRRGRPPAVPARFRDWEYEIRRRGPDFAAKSIREPVLVSIVIRTHQRPHYLREALLSIQNQTYRHLEAIVIEDGPSVSREIVDQFADLSLHYEATGAPVGRCRAGNIGLRRARGKYVNFLDDDDLLYADHLEVLVGELEHQSNAVAAYSNGFEIETDVVTTEPFTYIEGPYRVIYASPFDRELLLRRNYIPIHCLMFRRELHDKEGGFDEALEVFEDWDLWLRFAHHGEFLSIDKTTTLYRVPASSEARAERQRVMERIQPIVLAKHERCCRRS